MTRSEPGWDTSKQFGIRATAMPAEAADARAAGPAGPLAGLDVGLLLGSVRDPRGHRARRALAALDAAVKRSLDVAVAACALGVMVLPMMVAGVLVAMDGGPVIFGHTRVGRGLKPFRCLKLRTMFPGAEATLREYLALHPDADEEWRREQKLAFDARVTPIGRFLRRTSLDELPQLINVLRGEMSLVGPRPVTSAEAYRYGAALSLYASVRPGITGPWQVSGRNDIGYESRVAMDAEYVRNRTVMSDLAILTLGTPRALLSRRGAR